jgi:PTH2 family peptidyl-tRNA hydrolase
MDNKIKQVIVVRKDLNMRTGKIAAQASHASMSFLCNRVRNAQNRQASGCTGYNSHMVYFNYAEQLWLDGSFTKIVLGVDSEEKLLEVYKAAMKLPGTPVFKIVDNGDTEFHGVPTLTCIALGPDYSSKIDSVTKDLKLI